MLGISCCLDRVLARAGYITPTATPILKTGASGLPDIAWPTRLANEMFRSQPDSPVPFAAFGSIGAPTPSTPLLPATAAEVPQPPNAAAGLSSTDTALPEEADTRGVLASPPATDYRRRILIFLTNSQSNFLSNT